MITNNFQTDITAFVRSLFQIKSNALSTTTITKLISKLKKVRP